MTSLHWAAYHGDRDLVQILLRAGAKQTVSKLGYTPVDIAGFSLRREVVEGLAYDYSIRILKCELKVKRQKMNAVDGQEENFEEELDALKFEIQDFNKRLVAGGRRLHRYFAYRDPKYDSDEDADMGYESDEVSKSTKAR